MVLYVFRALELTMPLLCGAHLSWSLLSLRFSQEAVSSTLQVLLFPGHLQGRCLCTRSLLSSIVVLEYKKKKKLQVMVFVQVAQISAVTFSFQPVIFLEPKSQTRPGYLPSASSWAGISTQSTPVPLAPHKAHPMDLLSDYCKLQWQSFLQHLLCVFRNDSTTGNDFRNLTHEGLFFLSCSKIHKHTVYQVKHF